MTLRGLSVPAVVGARFLLANGVGAVVVFTYLNYVSDPSSDDADEVRILLFFGGYFAMTPLVGTQRLLSRTGPVRRWVACGRPATPAEQAAVLRLPRHLAQDGALLWLGAALLFGTLAVLDNGLSLELVRIVGGILLGGLSTTALSFLLIERRCRKLVAAALAGGLPDRTQTVGIRPRLLLAWALGSGVPLLGVAVAPFGEEDGTTVDLAVLAVLGLVSGGLMIAVVARSLADRLERVRVALSAVRAGDVDVRVEVDEGGELGLLQAGVNDMAAGLAERQRLRDLFGRHVGDAVAHQALERGTGLGGEVREVSALFVDVTGSTRLAATRPAVEVVTMLNGLFDAVVACVGAEGGWVNKFEGDGALCVFGAPGDQPDHPARALRAAVALRREVVRLGERHGGLDAGIGVSSGPAVAGNVGAEARYEYTVIGDPVNEAARLTELAKTVPARVLASATTVGAAGPRVGAGWERLGPVELRGRPRPTEAYAPVAVRANGDLIGSGSSAASTSPTQRASDPGPGDAPEGPPARSARSAAGGSSSSGPHRSGPTGANGAIDGVR